MTRPVNRKNGKIGQIPGRGNAEDLGTTAEGGESKAPEMRDVAQYEASTPSTSAAPLDMGCGILMPVRSTEFSLISSYEYRRDKSTRILDKVYPSYAINVTTAGTWVMQRGSQREVLTPGSIIVGSPGEEYACAHSHAHPNSNVVLGLSDRAVDPELRDLFGATTLTFDAILPVIWRAASASSDDEFDSLMFEIFDTISRATHERRERMSDGSFRTQRIKRFIERHAVEHIALADIAAVVNLNPFTCLRQFKNATGITPYAYLAQCRMMEAMRLLQRGNFPIEEVSGRAGFATHAYFSRFFKRQTGLTPTEFRRQALRA